MPPVTPMIANIHLDVHRILPMHPFCNALYKHENIADICRTVFFLRPARVRCALPYLTAFHLAEYIAGMVSTALWLPYRTPGAVPPFPSPSGTDHRPHA